jgi:hypothetical protein
MSAKFTSSAELPLLSGVGIVGFTVYDADGELVAPRTTAGVLEQFVGSSNSIYQAFIEVPVGITSGIVIWDDGSGNAVDKPFFIGQTNAGEVSVGLYSSTLDSEWGGVTADSYISLLDAEELVQKYAWSTDSWAAATGQNKDALLRFATRRIDMQNYVGRKQVTIQALQWPRYTDFWLPETFDQIKADVQLATVLESLDLITQRGMSRHQQNIAAGLKQISESVGPIRDQYTYQSGGPTAIISVEASRIMAKYQQSKNVFRA